MYSRSTERRGRTNLPPGYDGNAFRHDTGEWRSFGYPTEMKIHDAGMTEEVMPPERELAVPAEPERKSEPQPSVLSVKTVATPHSQSFLAGMLDSLGKEEWLLLFLIFLLLADGSDAWEMILLLVVLLGVREK